MPRNSRSIFYFTHLFVDHAIIVLAFLAAVWIAKVQPFPMLGWTEHIFALFLLIVWNISSRAYGIYTDRAEHKVIKSIFQSINSIIIQAILTVMFIFVIDSHSYSRFFVLTYCLLLAICIPFSRIVLKSAFLWLFKRGNLVKRAIVIGDGNSGIPFYEYLSNNQLAGYHVLRYIRGEVLQRTRGSLTEALNRIAIGETGLGRIDEVFLTESESGAYNTKEIAKMLNNYSVRLRLVPLTNGTPYGAIPLHGRIGTFSLISINREPLADLYNSTIKRIFDIVFSVLVVLLVYSWLFPLIGLLIKLDSKGPVFYKQERWGKGNRRFLCYKFRSMSIASKDLDENGKFQQAKKGDPRITRVGAFLRRTNIDELPQFINVLRGEMSVVGPRPHASQMNLESVETIDKYLVRHQVKPGITGWAQVNGLRGESEAPGLLEARVLHDIWYIQHWSFLLDLKIVFLTFWKMIVGDKQAY